MAERATSIAAEVESDNKEQSVNLEAKSKPNEKHLEFLQNNIAGLIVLCNVV